MSCPNCGRRGSCHCTWDEQADAMRIIRKREAEERRRTGNPTVVEQEQAKEETK